MLSWTPLVVLALLALVPSAHAYWILGHHNLVSQRLDPIIAPNGISGHTHAFVGSAAIQPGQDVNTMCTTSPVKADLSKYWAPQLYYYNGDTRKFASINLGTVNTYYLNRGGPKMGEDSSSLQPFPKGLKMIAGSAMLFDAPNSDPIKAKAVSFVCLGGNNPQTTTLPTGVCSGGMRAQIVFPSCWNGKDLDSDDHQSHVAYPIGGQADTGDCPSTHPIKFMTLFYEFIYDTGSLQGSVTKGNSSSGFVLANGDAIGYSFHADFVSDWDTTVLKAAIDECDGELGGNIRQCAPFVPSIHEETTTPNSADPAAGYCRTGAAVNEVVLGSNFDALPGCQTVKNGPFKGAGAGCAASSPTTTATPNNSTPADAAYRGCYQEPTNARALVNKVSYKGQMSTSVCRAACSAAGFSVAGMEYGQECWCDNSMTSGAKKVSDDFCNMACPGNSTETCGGSSLLSVYSVKAVTTTAATSIPPTAGTSSYQGCYQELSGGRALSKASYSNSTNTPTQCAAFCASKGLQFSATQYSSECYCGASISTAKLADSQCSMLCSGDKTSFCGAASRLQVYKDNAWKQSQFTVMQQGQWNFTDCAVDSPSARTLPTGISNPANTVAGCLAGCQAKKMTFCGVEYGGECWGATKLPTGFKASNAEPVARGCSMPCNGNSTLYCGGSSRMNLYTFFSNASPTRPTVLA